MKIETNKNEYGHMVAHCPFCKKWVYLRDKPDPIRDLKRHITHEAKKEGYAIAMETKIDFTPHLDYYKAHTRPIPPKILIEKREYDNDLQI